MRSHVSPWPWLAVACACALAAGLGLAGLAGSPAAASASHRPDRANVAYPHSPELLRQLAGPPGAAPAAVRSAIRRSALAGAAQGVDVAAFQHADGPINWAEVARSGIRFAVIKATEGHYYQNPYALTDLAAARAAGLATMAYAFAIPNGDGASASPVAQAKYLVSYLASGGVSARVALDIEYNPYGDECYGLSPSAMVAWIASFDHEVRALTGHRPFIYTPPAWWQRCTGGSTAFGAAPLWVPDYATGDSPGLPAGWTAWRIWQYTSAGTVPGIKDAGSTDLDQVEPGAALP
jgi:GH25 family lysozyme M1 (1,4-beta-N-acetylmuramidase)